MRKYVVVFVWLIVTASAHTVSGEDLYRVAVRSQEDAARLIAANVDAVLRIASGYLVLADHGTASALEQDGIPIQLVAS